MAEEITLPSYEEFMKAIRHILEGDDCDNDFTVIEAVRRQSFLIELSVERQLEELHLLGTKEGDNKNISLTDKQYEVLRLYSTTEGTLSLRRFFGYLHHLLSFNDADYIGKKAKKTKKMLLQAFQIGKVESLGSPVTKLLPTGVEDYFRAETIDKDGWYLLIQSGNSLKNMFSYAYDDVAGTDIFGRSFSVSPYKNACVLHSVTPLFKFPFLNYEARAFAVDGNDAICLLRIRFGTSDSKKYIVYTFTGNDEKVAETLSETVGFVHTVEDFLYGCLVKLRFRSSDSGFLAFEEIKNRIENVGWYDEDKQRSRAIYLDLLQGDIEQMSRTLEEMKEVLTPRFFVFCMAFLRSRIGSSSHDIGRHHISTFVDLVQKHIDVSEGTGGTNMASSSTSSMSLVMRQGLALKTEQQQILEMRQEIVLLQLLRHDLSVEEFFAPETIHDMAALLENEEHANLLSHEEMRAYVQGLFELDNFDKILDVLWSGSLGGKLDSYHNLTNEEALASYKENLQRIGSFFDVVIHEVWLHGVHLYLQAFVEYVSFEKLQENIEGGTFSVSVLQKVLAYGINKFGDPQYATELMEELEKRSENEQHYLEFFEAFFERLSNYLDGGGDGDLNLDEEARNLFQKFTQQNPLPSDENVEEKLCYQQQLIQYIKAALYDDQHSGTFSARRLYTNTERPGRKNNQNLFAPIARLFSMLEKTPGYTKINPVSLLPSSQKKELMKYFLIQFMDHGFSLDRYKNQKGFIEYPVNSGQVLFALATLREMFSLQEQQTILKEIHKDLAERVDALSDTPGDGYIYMLRGQDVVKQNNYMNCCISRMETIIQRLSRGVSNSEVVSDLLEKLKQKQMARAVIKLSTGMRLYSGDHKFSVQNLEKEGIGKDSTCEDYEHGRLKVFTGDIKECGYHSDIFKKFKITSGRRGGGWIYTDPDNAFIYLHGYSTDYGSVNLSAVAEWLKTELPGRTVRHDQEREEK